MAGATALAEARGRRRRGSDEGKGAPGRSHFRPDIEGLRAVAVGLVVADHVFGWPAGGFIGVDVFFVISGFLITGLLVRERARSGRISFRAFYARRIRRLFPAALVTLGATTLGAYLVFLGGRFHQTVTDVAWAALFGANIHFASEGTDYFHQTGAPSLVQHFWSLAVEEQFYLAWPALVLVAFALPLAGARRRRAALVCVLGGVTVASVAWSLHATSTSPATAYFSTFTRAWELGLGALVAVSVTQVHRIPAHVRAVLAWLGLAGVFAAAFLIDDRTPFPGSAAALPVLGTAFLVAWGDAPGGPGTRWALASPPARCLGSVSYSLYLWHWPVVVLAAALFTSDSTAFRLGVVGVSLALAAVSYYCIEQPVLHTNWLLSRRTVDPVRARRVFRRARWVGLAAVMAGALSASLMVVDQRGDAPGGNHAAAVSAAADRQESLTPLQRDIQAATLATQWPADLDPSLAELPTYGTTVWPADCLRVDADMVDHCRFGAPDAARSAVLLGDSYADAWLPAFRQALVPAGWSVVGLTDGQCPNLSAMTLMNGQPFTRCVRHRDWAIDYINATRPSLVVLSNAWTATLQDESLDLSTAYHDGLVDIIHRLAPSGARIVIMGGPPGSANLQQCPTALNGPEDCLQGPKDTFATEVATEARVAAETGVTAIDPEPFFCIDGLCPTFVGSTPVYFDGAHITVEYAERISPDVIAAIGGLP